MNRKFIHHVLVSISNVAIKTFMVSLTALFAVGFVSLVFKLITEGVPSGTQFGIYG